MNRRRFLGFLATSTAAMASACTASAQSRPGTSRAAASRAAASRPGTRAVPNEVPVAPRSLGGASAPGVTKDSVTVSVIAGFSEGIQLMVPGETRRLWIPEALAYKGQQGRPAGMLASSASPRGCSRRSRR